jgi:3-methyladenine DNA glycosylase AlkD
LKSKNSSTTAADVISQLRQIADPKWAENSAHFGNIQSKQILGISVPKLRNLADKIGTDHLLAVQLWKSGIMEARILAAFIDDPKELTDAQMDGWASGFDSWALCDACCCNLFDKSPLAWKKAVEWSRREEEYVKRAAFALIAALAGQDRRANDGDFLRALPLIKRESGDDRDFVRKAVNWALRQIGKRNVDLNRAAIQTAKEIQSLGTRSGRWIATNAIRELESPEVKTRLAAKRKTAAAAYRSASSIRKR